MAAGSSETLRQLSHAAPHAGVRDGCLEKPKGDLWEIPFAADDLYEVRQLLTGWAAREGMESEPADELVLSVHEIATNSVRHGGGVGMLRLWRTSRTLVCEVQDAGQLGEAMLGATRPGAKALEGRGMWIAKQLCDLVQIRSGTGGTQVRMHKHLV